MKILSKDIVHHGNFLNIHHYKLDDGRTYEVCSRRTEPGPQECDAVDIIAFNEDKSKLCIITEFRPPVEDYIISFPAGLREPGEEILDTARRELFEECNLEIIDVIKILRPSFQSPGMTDENVATVICTTKGDISHRNANPDEDLEPSWITKYGARIILDSPWGISGRCQFFLAMWSGFIDGTHSGKNFL